MRVGLLEDDVAIEEMLTLVLQDEGYTVVAYSNAQECLDALGVTRQEPVDLPVDLIIVDWRLTGPLSGIEVIQQIRDNPRLQPLPIILTTAATISDTGTLQHLHVALLEKPFSVDEMTTLIKEMVQPLSSN